MNANVLELLIDLFSRKMDPGAHTSHDLAFKHAQSISEMNQADLSTAMTWLESLIKQSKAAGASMSPSETAIRMYNDHERKILNPACLQMLADWQKFKIINALQREVIVEQMLSLDIDEITTTHLRWVTFLVLTAEMKKIEQIFWLDYILLSSNQTINKH